jgi:uncharacterized SAM-binding protein YcdF (DUF218 family)
MPDVIICLGNTFLTPKTINSMDLRVEKAVKLYKQGKAKKIIFTGGFKTRKDLSEAKYMAKLAIRAGVPKKDIILEKKSNYTIDNAKYSSEIMKKKGFGSAIIVTSPTHMPRTKLIFRTVMRGKNLFFEKSKNHLNLPETLKEAKKERKLVSELKNR